ncbi:MAG TPA: hypothetical protein VGR86_02995 [Steroidobacteraceae bacterium]|nr:hypothetical protein [Steroidobacteraceae bacterium]
MNYWSYKTVRLNDSWGPGAAHSLTTPTGQKPEFSMHPRYVREPQGNRHLAHFAIDFPSGFMPDGWQGVNFVPLGSVPAAGIAGLPAWNPSQQATYRQAIDAATSLSDSRTLRLEAVIPYVDLGQLGYNKVRLFYLENAVNGPIRDLVVVKIATHVAVPGTVQGRQDGSSQGPPH